jgi:hypothetical protein
MGMYALYTPTISQVALFFARTELTALLEVSFPSYYITSTRYCTCLPGLPLPLASDAMLQQFCCRRQPMATVAVVYLRLAAVTDRGVSAMSYLGKHGTCTFYRTNSQYDDLIFHSTGL